ncbi:MAG: helix-turn-helix transcriptional regulator [Bdellovibrionota bacterium]|mgnify:CR=1 FL=1
MSILNVQIDRKKTPHGIGTRLIAARKARGWTRAELARRAQGITAEAIRQIETGEIYDPGIRNMSRITQVLGISLNDLLGREN